MKKIIKNIGLIGGPYSGQTALLCGIIGELRRSHSARYEVLKSKDLYLDEDFKELTPCIEHFAANGCFDSLSFPDKTAIKSTWLFPVSCSVQTNSNSLHLNNMAGEEFEYCGNERMKLFVQKVEHVIFVIPPQKDDCWYNPKDVFCCLVNAINEIGNMAAVSFRFVLTKCDNEHLKQMNINTSSQENIKEYLENEYGLKYLTHTVEMRFKEVNYYTTSVCNKDDIGLQTLCNDLLAYSDERLWWKKMLQLRNPYI
jgi:hypothetical protein